MTTKMYAGYWVNVNLWAWNDLQVTLARIMGDLETALLEWQDPPAVPASSEVHRQTMIDSQRDLGPDWGAGYGGELMLGGF